MAVKFPRRHIERLIKVGSDSNAGATRLSATVVESWLDSLNYEDPVAVLKGVMSALGQLPSCAEDFLGNELYDRVQRVCDECQDEDDEFDDDDELDEDEE